MKGSHEALVWGEIIAMDGYTGKLPFRWNLRIQYKTTDPFAVTFLFLAKGAEFDWECARALVIAGLHHPAGEVNVHVRPWDGPDAGLTEVTIRPPAGRIVFLVPTGVLTRFVDRTLRLVPRGAEHLHLDVDAAICALLDGAA